MTYAVIEKMYTALSVKRQEEIYDFICYLFSKEEKASEKLNPNKSYSQSLDEFRAKYQDLLNDPNESKGIDEAFENLREYDSPMRGTQEEIW